MTLGEKWRVYEVKNLPDNAGGSRDTGLIPGSGRSPGAGNNNPFQHSCLENSMDRGTWSTTVHKITKSQTWLSDWVCACVRACVRTHTHTYVLEYLEKFELGLGKDCYCRTQVSLSHLYALLLISFFPCFSLKGHSSSSFILFNILSQLAFST